MVYEVIEVTEDKLICYRTDDWDKAINKFKELDSKGIACSLHNGITSKNVHIEL